MQAKPKRLKDARPGDLYYVSKKVTSVTHYEGGKVRITFDDESFIEGDDTTSLILEDAPDA